MGESRLSVHRALGGGAVADALLWKNMSGSVAFLVGSTALWILFDMAGYNLVSFISNVLLLLIVILFFWAKSASLLNRPLPPLPNLEVSEEAVLKAADEIRVWVNHGLSMGHDIAIGGNMILFMKVSVVLWAISYIGSFFNFITLVYIGALLSLSLPVVYEKYQNPIDDKLSIACNIARVQYQKLDVMILQKIPMLSNKEKKTQ